jgi:hypothetical protein
MIWTLAGRRGDGVACDPRTTAEGGVQGQLVRRVTLPKPDEARAWRPDCNGQVDPERCCTCCSRFWTLRTADTAMASGRDGVRTWQRTGKAKATGCARAYRPPLRPAGCTPDFRKLDFPNRPVRTRKPRRVAGPSPTPIRRRSQSTTRKSSSLPAQKSRLSCPMPSRMGLVIP